MPDLKNSNRFSSAEIAKTASMETADVLQLLGSSHSGLDQTEAAARLERYGPNQFAQEKHYG